MSSVSRIEAKEAKAGELFSEQFIFEVPIYQRPLSWAREHFEQLITDIMDAMNSQEEQYFLGSIVLNERKERRYEVIDGQQRLTALTILLAIIRDLIRDEDRKREIHSYIYQEERPLKGIPAIMRVVPWEDLQRLFQDYIYTVGKTRELLEDFMNGRIKYADKQDPVYHLYEAVSVFYEKLSDMDDRQLEELSKYLLNNVYFVYIKTTSRSSAFRLFNVLNTRGLPLSTIDILKSVNLEAIDEDHLRKKYAYKWRELEEDIGREELDNLIAYVRMIKVKRKARLSMYDEYERMFKAGLLKKGMEFFEYIYNMAEIYRDKILDPQINAKNSELKNRYIAIVDVMKRYLPFSDWIPPVMAFHHKFRDEDALSLFLLKLEKKVFIEWLAGFSVTERITSMARILRLIEKSNSSEDVINNMFVHEEEEPRKGKKGRVIDFHDRKLVEEILIGKLDDPQLYTLHGGKLAKYVLLRMDIELWNLESVLPKYQGMVTVEHILPRNPPPDSEWIKKFSEEERRIWTDKLGNLVLLSGRKNSKAGTRDFKKKKETYFRRKCTPFRITQEIMDYDDWNVDVLENRHHILMERAKDIYLTL